MSVQDILDWINKCDRNNEINLSVLQDMEENLIAESYKNVTATASDVRIGKQFINNSGALITGTAVFVDTSDATATAAEIVKDKTAYVNGVKLTGTLDMSNIIYDGGEA